MKNVLVAAVLLFASVGQATVYPNYPGAPGIDGPVNTYTQTEDRGDVIVQTITTSYAVDATQFCIIKTVIVTEKATGTVLSNKSESNCTNY